MRLKLEFTKISVFQKARASLCGMGKKDGMWGKFKLWIQNKIGIGENRDKIAQLEKKLNMLHALVQLNSTETLALHGVMAESNFAENHPNVASKFLQIHKNDLMFLYPLYHHNGNIQVVFEEYMRTGMQTAHSLWSWWQAEKGSKMPSTILDFGGGYGRVSRFLPAHFPQAEITVSEVKADALTFQQLQFGFNILWHTSAAHSFSVNQKFDLIFAGSVFSHLNKNDFEAWLQTLLAALANGGILAITTHNIATIKKNTPFLFVPNAEDFVLPAVQDGLRNKTEYGSTYVSDAYLQSLFNQHQMDVKTIHMGFGGTQDVHLLQKI